MTANTAARSTFALGVRSVLLVLLTLMCAACSMAQAADANLTSELEAIYAKWFQAYDSANRGALEEMETANLTLVLPDGTIWAKSKPRAQDKLPEEPPDLHHSLSNTATRRFGDTPVLTGMVTAASTKEGVLKCATTVVFIRDAGKWKIAAAQWTPIPNQ